MNDNIISWPSARPRERAFPQPAPDKITIVELRGKIGPDRPDLFESRNEELIYRDAERRWKMERPSFGERLVLWMRLNGDLCMRYLIAFVAGSLFTCAAAAVLRWTVLS
jgi:hypothetical protein